MPVGLGSTNAPQNASPTPPGRIEQPQAAMTGPHLGPRPAALPSNATSKKSAVTIVAPSAVGERGVGDLSIPHPAAPGGMAASAGSGNRGRAERNIPSDPFEESVYRLIPEEYIEPPKADRYRSRFAKVAKEEYKKGKKSAASMGPAKVPVPNPKGFLKGREREKGGKAPPQQPDRVIRKAPLPKEPGQIPAPTKKDFVRVNALDNINSAAKKPPSPPPAYVTKKTYGRVPPYIQRTSPTHSPTPHITQEKHQQSHIKSSTTSRRELVEQELEREHRGNAMEEGGLIPLPQDEREEILKGLQKNWERLNSEYQRLSLTVDTVPKIARKVNMEQQLKELEDNIHKFSHEKIMVGFGPVYAR